MIDTSVEQPARTVNRTASSMRLHWKESRANCRLMCTTPCIVVMFDILVRAASGRSAKRLERAFNSLP